jgi:hypothetical protein
MIFVSGPALAVDIDFYRQFIGREVIITVEMGTRNTRTVFMKVTDVDTQAGVISGDSYDGVAFVPLDRMIYLIERPSNMHGAYGRM